MKNNTSLTFTKNAKGQIETSISNVFKAISSPEHCGMHLRYTGTTLECAPFGTGEWRLFNDTDISHLRITLGEKGFGRIRPGMVKEVGALVALGNPESKSSF
ncbi:hypothetical protein LMR76_004660 [Salmonella enterica]|nr:hypothetical protein [Salmonella enterica]